MRRFIIICIILGLIFFIIGCNLESIDLSGQILVFSDENHSDYITIDSKSSYEYIYFQKKDGFCYNSIPWTSTKLNNFFNWTINNINLNKKVHIGQEIYEITANMLWGGTPGISIKDSKNKIQVLSVISISSIDTDKQVGIDPEYKWWESVESSSEAHLRVKFNEPTSKQDFLIKVSYTIEVEGEKVLKNQSLNYIKANCQTSMKLEIKNTKCLFGSQEYQKSENKLVDIFAKVLDYNLDGEFTENDVIILSEGLFTSTGMLPFNKPTKLYKLGKKLYIFNLKPHITTMPTEINGLNDILAVATGKTHSLALKADGTVLAWGDNSRGQLGLEDTAPRYRPKSIQKFTDIVAVAAGNEFSAALKRDGTVWMWGDNKWGQLGIDLKEDYITKPIQVPGLSGIKAIALGEDFSVALKEDGTVWAWGNNYYGQLGDGTYISRNVPKCIPNLSEIKQIVVANKYALALKTDGTIWLWGKHPALFHYLAEPRQISRIKDVTALAVGDYHRIALKDDGTVWSLGLTSDGLLDLIFTPVQIQGLTDVIDIGASSTYSMAVKKDGTVWVWGSDNEGMIGMVPATTMSPVQISALNDIKMILLMPLTQHR